MTCAFCNKFIKKGEEFVLFGKYPSYWNLFTIWFWNMDHLFYPEQFGEVYHRSCFMKMVRRTIAEEEKKKKEEKV